MTHGDPRNNEMESILRDVLRTLDNWGASAKEICRILEITQDDLVKWRNRPPNTLDDDTMERVILIEGIAKHLEVLFPLNHLRWPSMQNDSPTFGGATPLSVLATGRISEIRRVKRWLAGWSY